MRVVWICLATVWIAILSLNLATVSVSEPSPSLAEVRMNPQAQALFEQQQRLFVELLNDTTFDAGAEDAQPVPTRVGPRSEFQPPTRHASALSPTPAMARHPWKSGFHELQIT